MTDQVQQNQPSGMNRHQVAALREIAEQQITQALTAFAQQLPNGMMHLQGAINGAGAVLDRLMMETGVFDDAATQESPTEANPDLAAQRLDITTPADQSAAHDVTSGA